VRKQLKDYPQDEWMEAADGCEFCGAKHMVKIAEVDETGNFGTVIIKTEHREDCPELFDDPAPVRDPIEEQEDYAGWEFVDKPYALLGKEYYPLSSRANIGPCLECGKLVVGVPLILFLDKGRGGELDFCFECAEKLGILKALTGGTSHE
jgi:hypothetical protein